MVLQREQKKNKKIQYAVVEALYEITHASKAFHFLTKNQINPSLIFI